MRIEMHVFSVDEVDVPVVAALPDGTQVNASVRGKRVQLTSDKHGSWTLNLTGADAAAWTTPAWQTVDVDI